MSDQSLPYDWERNGNTLWVACPNCDWNFPISSSLAENNKVNCFCPSCETQFRPGDTAAASKQAP